MYVYYLQYFNPVGLLHVGRFIHELIIATIRGNLIFSLNGRNTHRVVLAFSSSIRLLLLSQVKAVDMVARAAS